MPAQQWEYAVLRVELVSVEPPGLYLAQAWVYDQEIYNKHLSSMYWSVPLGDFGRAGWELVGTSQDNAVVGLTTVAGWVGNSDASMPVRMTFFFKRPVS